MTAHDDRQARVSAYVWDPVVRVTHWLIFGAVIVLSATGFYIGKPFGLSSKPANLTFVMGWVRLVHSYSAMVFSLSIFARLIWMFTGPPNARWNQFVPATRQRRRDLWGTFLFYTFIRRDPPPAVGHNALAGFSYIGVFAMYGLMIFTGLALYLSAARTGSYLHVLDFLVPLFGGLQTTRWIHHVCMYLILGFMVHHIYSGWLMSKLEQNGTIDSIFTGYKYLPKDPHA
jgi:Ni/Fe-hydrogenase 1 B-type cytochrome subunit